MRMAQSTVFARGVCRYQQHLKPEVGDILKDYRIGTLSGEPLAPQDSCVTLGTPQEAVRSRAGRAAIPGRALGASCANRRRSRTVAGKYR